MYKQGNLTQNMPIIPKYFLEKLLAKLVYTFIITVFIKLYYISSFVTVFPAWGQVIVSKSQAICDWQIKFISQKYIVLYFYVYSWMHNHKYV